MAFDRNLSAQVAQELKNTLLMGKIGKIYQPESDELVFHIHKRKPEAVRISTLANRARIHLIERKPSPQSPAPLPFCMFLRKHLQGGRITDIAQKGL